MNHNFSSQSPAFLLNIMRRIRTGTLLFACLCAAACVYRAPIQQGNLLKAKDTDQVTKGMTQAQVRYLLGTPMVSDPFSKDRWDYVYYLKLNFMPKPKEQKFIVYFDNGNVIRTERIDGGVGKMNGDASDKLEKAPWYRRWLNWSV